MTMPEAAKGPLEISFPFVLRVTGSGWAAARWGPAAGRISVTASGVFGDAPAHLLSAIRSAVEGQARAEASWNEEPGEYRWVFDSDGGVTRVRILRLAGTRAASPERLVENDDKRLIPRGENRHLDFRDFGVLLDLTGSTAEIARLFVAAFSAEYSREGELGYWEEWGYQFPIDDLSSIRRALGMPPQPRVVGSTLRINHDLDVVEWLVDALAAMPGVVSLGDIERRLDSIRSSAPILQQAKRRIRQLMRATPFDVDAARRTAVRWREVRQSYEGDPLAWLENRPNTGQDDSLR